MKNNTASDVRHLYFEWIYSMMCGGRYEGEISFRKLFKTLHSIEFRYIILLDKNRAADGVDLRNRFLFRNGYPEVDEEFFYEPCSVLEMMAALAIRCEESIMEDPTKGDRTAQWFWVMIKNLGLGAMMDDLYDHDKVVYIINRFLDRKYAPNGKGGLFIIKNCDQDLRDVEIWYQLCWYTNTIV